MNSDEIMEAIEGAKTMAKRAWYSKKEEE